MTWVLESTKRVTLLLVILILGVATSLAYIIIAEGNIQNAASEIKELVNISNTQRKVLTAERYALDNLTSKSLAVLKTRALQVDNISNQNLKILAGLTGTNQQILALSPLLFNDLSVKQYIALKTLTHANVTSKTPIVFLTDAHFSDGGWGTQGFNGIKTLNATSRDGITIPDVVSSLVDYGITKPALIIAQGFQWGDPVFAIAHDFPDTKFVVMTGLVNGSNIASIYPEQQQGSFLLGALAGMMTKTNTIGFIGGETYPNIVNIGEGYKQGALYVNPKVKVISTYLHDFNSPSKGKAAALWQISLRADFILHTADTSGQGVIQAANESGIYAFGAVADQNRLAPDTVLTSFVIDMNKAYAKAYQDVLDNKFNGTISRPGLETGKGAPGDGIVYIAPFHGLDARVPENVKLKLSQLTNEIISGQIKIAERTTPSS